MLFTGNRKRPFAIVLILELISAVKIFITGGAGFIGSNLVRLIIKETDHSVTNFDKLTYAGNPESLIDVEESPRYEFIKGDLLDLAVTTEALKKSGAEAIIHLAAESHVDRSIDHPAPFIQTNVLGTYNLLQASMEVLSQRDSSRTDHFRFLHVSTDEVFGSLHSAEQPFTETSRYAPNSPYSASKASSDHLVRAWQSTFGLPALVTHCSNNYGPFQFPEKLIPVVILKCLQGEAIPVYGNGQNIRDWLFVEDHCRALLAVMEKGTLGETYNIGANHECSNLDLVQTVCRIMDQLHSKPGIESYESLIHFVPDRPGHDFRYAMDSKKIRAELDWKPQEKFNIGLAKTVKWYLDHPTWWRSILAQQR